MYECLANSGFKFMNETKDEIILEHWYTGLRISYNKHTDTYAPLKGE